MVDEYTRKRLDEIADHVSVTRTKVEGIETDLAAGRTRFQEHDSRIRRLEIWRGGLVLLGGFLTIVVGWVIAAFKGFFHTGGH